MLRRLSWLLNVIVFTIVTLLFPASLSAQSIWLDRSHDKTIALEILKPNFEGEDNTTFTTSALFLSLRFPVAEKVVLVAELPFAHGGFDSDFGDSESESTIGNPYLGLEIRGRNSPVFAEIGFRAPLASEDNFGSIVGLFSDIDRLEAFLADFLPINGMINYRHKDASGFAFRLRGGATFFINTDKQEFEDASESYIGYSAQLGYESDQVSVGGGFTGRALLTEEDLDYGERSFHQLGFVASIGLGEVRPGAYIRLPLDDDLKETLDFVFGLNLGIRLK